MKEKKHMCSVALSTTHTFSTKLLLPAEINGLDGKFMLTAIKDMPVLVTYVAKLLFQIIEHLKFLSALNQILLFPEM